LLLGIGGRAASPRKHLLCTGTIGIQGSSYIGRRMSMSRAKIEIPKEKLAEFCHRHHIRKLSLFGSVLTESFTPESDVDVLVEFEPERTPGMLRMAGLELELSELLGRKVDLRTAAELSRYFREEVVCSGEIQYAQA
jgi:hypothetical protein